jgi:cytochrome c oxidase assembly protein Cox11
MKIHMDYLEAQVEEYENVKVQWEAEKRGLHRKFAAVEEKGKVRIGEMEKEIEKMREETERKLREAEERLQTVLKR